MKKRFVSWVTAVALAITLLAVPVQALTPEQAAELLAELYIDEVPQEVLDQPDVKSMVAALGDPYTEYFTPEEYQAFTASMSDTQLVGIGVVFTRTGTHIDETGLAIDRILDDSPASRGGLMPGDRLLAVDGHSLVGLDLDSAADYIRGEEGSQVTVTYLRDGIVQEAVLTRSTVVVAATTTQLIDDHIGYISCTTFGAETAGHFKDGIETYGDQADVWIVDLRSNLGGSAEAATTCAGYFAGAGYMSILRNGADMYSAYSHSESPLTLSPVIVLVDQYSASASEIFASAIQSYRAGIVVGTRTFGKGVAQVVIDQTYQPDYFQDGDAIKITAYRFYSPDGNTTDQIGVLPNLLTANEFSSAVALLLSSDPQGKSDAGTLRVDLSWRWYVDLGLASDQAWQDAFAVMLDALPAGTSLYLEGEDMSDWTPVTKEELAETYGLTLTRTDFSDLEDSSYPHAIQVLQTYGLLNGFEDGTVAPLNSLRRSELCQILATALNLRETAIENPYLDVSEDAWYAPAVLSMTNLGFVGGIGDGLFDPEGTVTHEQLITVMGRLAQFLNMNFYNTARDIPEDALSNEALTDYADWSRPSAWLLSSGQTNLFGGPVNLLWDSVESISPNAPATREETAALFYQLLSYCGIL